MVTHILGASAPADDFSRRQVLDLSHAVIGPRFRRRDWERAAQIREAIDIDLRVPQTPRPERNDDPAESIVMFSNVIENRMTTGAHVVRLRRVTDLDPLPELAIAAEPFATVADDSIRGAASEALAAINNRKPSARRAPRPAVPKPPKATRPAWIATALVLAALVIAMLLVTVARADDCYHCTEQENEELTAEHVLPPALRELGSLVDEEISPEQAGAVIGLVRQQGYVCQTVSSLHVVVEPSGRRTNYSLACNHRSYAFLLFPELGGKWSVTAIR